MSAERQSAVVELRRYALRPGRREALIDLFERELVEPQEAAGMEIIAQFRDVDHPDVFTWLRGFPDMPHRAASLAAFYDGPVWARHRDAANATMLDSDNVWLLRPTPIGGFTLAADRAPIGATTNPAGLVVASICALEASAAPRFPAWFAREVCPLLEITGGRPIATFETEASANSWPRLPVREGEHAFVWFARFADAEAYERHRAELAADRRWSGSVLPALTRQLTEPVATWRLVQTARSRVLP